MKKSPIDSFIEIMVNTLTMNKRTIPTLSSIFSGIAQSIRHVDGTEETMTPRQMPQRILDAFELDRILTPNNNLYSILSEIGTATRWCGGAKYITPSEMTNLPEVVYDNGYFRFRILESGTIVWKCDNLNGEKTIQYSINNGNWVSITSTVNGVVIPVEVGDVVRFKGTEQSYSNDVDHEN